MKLFSAQIQTVDQLPKVAGAFWDALDKYTIFAFRGQMGAGKTTFIKALCQHVQVRDNISSPTFSIVNEYRKPDSTVLYHFDFYRIEKIEEAFDFGYEDYFFSGSKCLIEWPEKIESLLPPDTVQVYIEVLPDYSRTLVAQI